MQRRCRRFLQEILLIKKDLPEGRSFSILASNAGVGSEAAVDGQDDTGNSGGHLVICEEEHTAQKFSGVNKAAHGGTRQDLAGTGLGGTILIEQQCPVLVGYDKTGSDGITADAGACKWVASHWVKLEMAAFAPE